MKTKAVRLYGKKDLRLEEFDLPPLKDNEVLAKIVTDSLCMSTYKAAQQGNDHKRVPDTISRHPVIVGHELCGEVVKAGNKWKDTFKPGMKFSLQPSLGETTFDAAGYSFPYFGGDATYVIIPEIYLKSGCVLEYEGEGFFPGSLSEPYSCVIGTYHAHYHTRNGSYLHEMGIRERGNMALLAAAGPMGVAAIDCIINSSKRPSYLLVTDISDERLNRIKSLITPEEAAKKGVRLEYLNTFGIDNVPAKLMKLSYGKGFDDILVFAPVKAVVEIADKILAKDGCLNFFAGPSDNAFSAEMNFYNIHYNATHVVATNAGNTDDLKEAIAMLGDKRLHPAYLVTHIGGLNAVIDATYSLPVLPGAKKLIYTHLDLPLTAITDVKQLGTTDPLFHVLADIVQKNNGLWSVEAENYLLENAKKI